MKDEQVRQECPLVAGEERHEVAFDLDGVGLPGQTQPGRNASDVGVHHHALIDAEGIAEHDVGGLPTNAGEDPQLLHRFGYITAVVRDEPLRHADQALRLVPEETSGPDDVLDLGRISYGQRRGVGIAGEQHRSDEIHPFVGALGREDGGGQQLEGIAVVEFAVGVGIFGQKPGEGFLCGRSALAGYPPGGHQWRLRAKATKSAADRVFSTCEGSMRAFRAMPTPHETFSRPATLWASAPIDTAAASSRARMR